MAVIVRLKRPLLDSDALRITLPLARNKVTVPFELKEVQLP